MLARVKRAKEFASDAKEVFRTAEHRCKDRSVPAKAVEMLLLKTMAGEVVRISEEYEALSEEVEEARLEEEEETARRAAEVAATESSEEDSVPDEASREQNRDSEDEEFDDVELLDPNAEEELLDLANDAAHTKDHELFSKGTQDKSMRTRKVRILKPAEKPRNTSNKGKATRSTLQRYRTFMSKSYVIAKKEYPSPESTGEPIEFSNGFFYCKCCNGVQVAVRCL
jgi:hypothetical protein